MSKYVDKLSKVVQSDLLQMQSLLVGRRGTVLLTCEQVEWILSTQESVVIDYLHRRHPVRCEVTSNLNINKKVLLNKQFIEHMSDEHAYNKTPYKNTRNMWKAIKQNRIRFEWQIRFKLLSSTYKAIHTGNPPYPADLLHHHKSTRFTHLSSSHLLDVPHHKLSFGSRAFRVSAP